jgi:hypothetical protein
MSNQDLVMTATMGISCAFFIFFGDRCRCCAGAKAQECSACRSEHAARGKCAANDQASRERFPVIADDLARELQGTSGNAEGERCADPNTF